jgi:uncharacterized protein YndB with AHSA1/START domain
MALKLSKSILIDRPAEQVWAYLNDESHDPVWRRPYCKQVHRQGPLAIGTRYEGVDNMGSYVNVLTVLEPSRRLTWHEESRRSMQQDEGNYFLTSEGNGTKMTLDLIYKTNGLKGTLISPVLSLMAPSLGRRLLNQLKEAVEEQPAG